jgi:uncharacterized protein YyaL (SSP411 family)
LYSAALKLIQSYDWKHGGWGGAPKFPQPMNLLYLLRRAAQGDKQALQISRHALDAMAQGGMYDLVGGGFARYSVDTEWLVPHFEKMLYDNAQLARAALHAYLLTDEPYYRRITEETLDFVLREMSHPDGGFFSSIDADSEGEEGRFYIWEYDELESILTSEEFDLLQGTHEITPEGNFEGKHVPRRKTNGPTDPETDPQVRKIYERLLSARGQRIRPATDDKVITAWNAWMNIAFAEAGRYLNHPGYLEAAQRNLAFLLDALIIDGRLLRSWRAGSAQHNAYLEDYASLILALLALYQADHDTCWFKEAQQLTDQMIELFSDDSRRFYDTAHDQPDLLLRPQETQDNATPSGASLAAQALLQMAAFTGEGSYRDQAEELLAPMQELLAAYPTAFGNWLSALDFALGDVKEIALLGELDSESAEKMLETVRSAFRPNVILAAGSHPPEGDGPPLLNDRPLIDGQPTAYVCQNFTCGQPTTDPEVLLRQIESNSSR